MIGRGVVWCGTCGWCTTGPTQNTALLPSHHTSLGASGPDFITKSTIRPSLSLPLSLPILLRIVLPSRMQIRAVRCFLGMTRPSTVFVCTRMCVRACVRARMCCVWRPSCQGALAWGEHVVDMYYEYTATRSWTSPARSWAIARSPFSAHGPASLTIWGSHDRALFLTRYIQMDPIITGQVSTYNHEHGMHPCGLSPRC